MSKFLNKILDNNEDNDDNIPEMKLQQNEPQIYYDKDLKCWMIEGQEEQIKKELEDRNRGPIGRRINRADENLPSITTEVLKRNLKLRYPSILPQEEEESEFDYQQNQSDEANKPNIFVPEPINNDEEANIDEDKQCPLLKPTDIFCSKIIPVYIF
jgi:hypothetical protein